MRAARPRERSSPCHPRRSTRPRPPSRGASTCRKGVEKGKAAPPTRLDMTCTGAAGRGAEDEYHAQHTPRTKPNLHKGAARLTIDAPARMPAASARARSGVPAQPRLTACHRCRAKPMGGAEQPEGNPAWDGSRTRLSVPLLAHQVGRLRERGPPEAAHSIEYSAPPRMRRALPLKTPGHPVTHQPGTERAPRRSACLDGAGLLNGARKRRAL